MSQKPHFQNKVRNDKRQDYSATRSGRIGDRVGQGGAWGAQGEGGILTGYEADGKTYKVHLDGYNQSPLLTGATKESPRKEVFYFSDDGDLTALRYGDWKLIFMEQQTEETVRIWAEPFVEPRFPLIVNLRRDPHERGMKKSNTYYK